MIKSFLLLLLSSSLLISNSITKKDLIHLAKKRKVVDLHIVKSSDDMVKTNNKWNIIGYNAFRTTKLHKYIKVKSKSKTTSYKSKKSFADIIMQNKINK